MSFEYSTVYADDKFEYRVVDGRGILPRKAGPLMTTEEWHELGIQMSKGWIHVSWSKEYPAQLIFKRPIGTNPATGNVDPVLREAALKKFHDTWG